jgi:protein tyrosine/serine phosphatase
MPRIVRYSLSILLVALLVGGPAGYAYYRQAQLRHFRVVQEGVLYRSGQMTLSGLKAVIHDYDIKTVITLRDGPYPGAVPPDLAEEEYCKAQEITYCRISPTCWGSEEGSVPAEEGVCRFRAIMNNPRNYPVLIHCFGGVHRTGIYCAIYHMEHDHWSNARAIADLEASGYDNLPYELDVLGYLEDYQPTWQQTERSAETDRSRAEHRPVKQAKRKAKKDLHKSRAPARDGA